MQGSIEASTCRYQILEPLGQGGMADVWLARRHLAGEDEPVAERLVALKRLKPELANDVVLRQMLVEEARLGAGFNHPNLVETYDLGQHDGAFFFTMELVRGHELREVVQAAGKSDEGRMPLSHVLTVVASIAAGLNYAHELRTTEGRRLNVVHLDVCPSNVLVGPEGFIKLIDFGIARHELSPDYKHESWSGMFPIPSDASVRRGTMAYMSPEQCLGRALDRRSDVFSLGVILWELTTWARLFRAPSRAEVFEKIVDRDAPSPRTLRPDYPRDLEAIVMQALSRDPEQRFANARALLVAIEEFAESSGLPTSTTRLGGYVQRLMDGAAPSSRVPSVTPTPGTTMPAHPVATTAPYGVVGSATASDRYASDVARRFQPISRRWRH